MRLLNLKKIKNNFCSRLALKHITKIIRKRPLDINIETTNFCPSKCIFCPNKKIKRTKQTMSMELFEKICKDYYSIGGGTIGISSMQSDIFSDDLLLDRLEILKKYKDKFYVYTTTNLVSAAKFSDDEIKEYLKLFNYIEISIGGVEKEEYKIMYGVDAFNVVKEQLNRFFRIIKENNLNIDVDIAIRTYQADKITNSQEFKELENLFPIHQVKDSFFSWYGNINQNELPEGAKLEISDNSNQNKDCVVPFATLSINYDGKVVGCGCIDWEGKYIVGNTNNQTINEIWQDKISKDFRMGFSNNNIPSLCKECALYLPKDIGFSNPVLRNYKLIDGLYYKL